MSAVENHLLLEVEMRFPETLEVVRAQRPARAVLSHIEEMDGLGHDQLALLAERHRAEGLPIAFARDMMHIDVG